MLSNSAVTSSRGILFLPGIGQSIRIDFLLPWPLPFIQVVVEFQTELWDTHSLLGHPWRVIATRPTL
jgi:hypothetical protein